MCLDGNPGFNNHYDSVEAHQGAQKQFCFHMKTVSDCFHMETGNSTLLRTSRHSSMQRDDEGN